MPRKTIFLTLTLMAAPGLTSCTPVKMVQGTPGPTVTVTKVIKVPGSTVTVTKPAVTVTKPAPTVTETVRGPIVKVEKTTEVKTVIKWKPGMPKSCWAVVKETLQMAPQDTVISDGAGNVLTALDQVNTNAYLNDYKAVNNLVQIIGNQKNLIGTAYDVKAKQMDYLNKQIALCRAETKP
jgi:ribosomal protein L21